MPILPPNPVYPLDYDTDRTLFKVFNTTETTLSSDLAAWATTINITPVGVNDDEIWAENGYATISGELIYYDDVQKDSNNKINALINCVRNLGGNSPKPNDSGTWIRGFVLAEHHNSLARAIVNSENFIGINLSPDKATLDWRIRNLTQPDFVDDYGCPQVNFIFYITNVDPLLGTTIEYSLEIVGIYDSFVLEFGDNTFTSTETNGTHVYPPNSTIDPTVTVYSTVCQTVNSGLARNQPNEPLITVVPDEQNITIDPIADFPDLQYITDPNTAADVNLPPIVFPCLDIGPFGPINIPSTIILDPPVIVPSQITFSNIPIIASTVSISPINIETNTSQFIELVCIPLGSGSGAGAGSSGAIGGLGYSGYARVSRTASSQFKDIQKVFYATDVYTFLSSSIAPIGGGGYQAEPLVYTASNSTGGYAFGSRVSKFVFATEKESEVSGSSAGLSSVVMGNADKTAYLFTRNVDNTGPNILYIKAYNYATNAYSNTGTKIIFMPYASTISQQYDKGYLCTSGGFYKFDYSTQALSARINSFFTYNSATTLDGNNQGGYIGGGNPQNGLYNANISKASFATDTFSLITSKDSLTSAGSYKSGLNEGSSKGYWAGCNPKSAGPIFGSVSQIFKYQTDTFVVIPKAGIGITGGPVCFSHIYLNPSPSPTPTPTPVPLTLNFTNIDPNAPPQFTNTSNGYELPPEAISFSASPETPKDFGYTSQGYTASHEITYQNDMFPTPSNNFDETIKNAMKDSFNTMKLMIKDGQIVPDANELLGE